MKEFLQLTLLFFAAYTTCHYSLSTWGVKEKLATVIAVIYAVIIALIVGSLLAFLG